MRIIIAGGTGFIGQPLLRNLLEEGHRVTVLTRDTGRAGKVLPSSAHIIEWDPMVPGPWEREFGDVDAVVNLAGEPIAEGRWTAHRKQLIWESRINSTNAMVRALRATSRPLCTLINASGIGYYGPSNGISIYESVGAGSGFLADLCVEWERAACRAGESGVRVVRLRFGMVLGTEGGALPKMVMPFRFFLGGPVMPGTQWISWIHRRDVIGLIHWALMNQRVTGAVNAVAPEPVTMQEFCRMLGKVLHKPCWLPVPALALRAGLGELATVMTTGQRVLPQVAVQGGYSFEYQLLESALGALYPSRSAEN